MKQRRSRDMAPIKGSGIYDPELYFQKELELVTRQAFLPEIYQRVSAQHKAVLDIHERAVTAVNLTNPGAGYSFTGVPPCEVYHG
jgi:hypothetical protein